MTAAADKRVKIMLPMVTSLHEIEDTKAILEQVRAKLKQAGTPYCEDAQLGIMIETPASAILAQQLAGHCDFFSIGTNDLVQYIMSADRGNAQVQKVYNPCHPAVLRMLAHVIEAGAQAGIEVSVCGDLAAGLALYEAAFGLWAQKVQRSAPYGGTDQVQNPQHGLKGCARTCRAGAGAGG